MAACYDIGDERRLQATIRNISDVLADPTGLTFEMTEPDGVTTTYVYLTDAQLVKSSTGVYYVDWPIDQSGRHYYKFTATGAVAVAEETSFIVQVSNIQ